MFVVSRALSRVLLCLVLVAFASGFALTARAGSVSVWHPLGFSRLGAQGERPTVLESQNYALQNNLTQARFDSLLIKTGAQPGANLFAPGPFGGLSLVLTDSDGKIYSSIFHNGSVQQGTHGGTPFYNTSMRLHLTGDLYHESEIIGIEFAAADGTQLPVEAQIHMFQWDDRIYFQVILNAKANIRLQKAEIVASFADGVFDRFRTELQPETPIPTAGSLVPAAAPGSGLILGSSAAGAGSLAWIIGDPTGTQSFEALRGSYGLQTTPTLMVRQTLCDAAVTHAETAFTSGTKMTNSFQLYFSPDPTMADAYNNLQAELHPLTLRILGSSSGAAVAGEYDKLNGTYTISMPTENANEAGYRFSNTFQNFYNTVKVEIPADPIPRVNRICIAQPTGLWGSAVTADQFGYPRGGHTMVARGLESFHVIKTAANTSDIFEHKGAFKRYGESPAYLISHEDLGSGYDPHGQMWLNAVNGINGGFSYSLVQRIYSSICDVSTINGNPKGGNPADQFPENTGGHEFLKFRTDTPNPNKPAATPAAAVDAAAHADSEFHQIEFPVNTAWHEIEFKALDYDRLSPLLIDANWRGFSDDRNIDTSIHLINVPFSDICRMFVHMRYEVKNPIHFDAPGALKRNFRLFSMGDENYGQSDYARLAYTDAAGTLRDGDWAEAIGLPLGGPHPFATVYPNFTSNRGMLVRSYKARINGQESNTPAITMQRIETKRAGFWLVPDSDAMQLIPGDYFDIELELAFYGTENSDYQPMLAEAQAWGGDGLQLDVARGTLLSTVPTRIEASEGQAEFILHGGRNYVPVEISGFAANAGPDYQLPLLEENINGVWVPFDPAIAGKDGWDVDRDETSGQSAFMYNIWTDGASRTFRFSLSANRLDFENSPDAGSAQIVPAEHGGRFFSQAIPDNSFRFDYALKAPQVRLVTPLLFARATAESILRLTVNGVDQPDFMLPAGQTFSATLLPEIELHPGTNSVGLRVEGGNLDLDYLHLIHERPLPTLPFDAVIVDYAFPTIINYGDALTAKLQVKNVGSQPWSGSDVALKSLELFDTPQSVALVSGETVAPGQIHTFEVPLPAPHVSAAGQYMVDVSLWSMTQHAEPFGQRFKHEIQYADIKN